MDSAIVKYAFSSVMDSISRIINTHDSVFVFLNGCVQSQSSSSETILGMSTELGAIIIPTMASIIVFIIGVIIDRCAKCKERKNETIAFRNTLFAWVDLNKKAVEDQIQIIYSFAKLIHQNTTLQNEALVFKKNMIGKLSIATAENVLKYLINNSSSFNKEESAVKAYNLISQIEFLSVFEEQILVQYKKYERDSLSLFEDWNRNIINIQNLSKNADEEYNFTILNSIKNIVKNWMEIQYLEDKVNIQLTEQYLIMPILKIASNFKLGQIGYEKCDSIILSAKELDIIYRRWKSIAEGFSEVFKDYADLASKSLKVLLDAKEYFSKNTKAFK